MPVHQELDAMAQKLLPTRYKKIIMKQLSTTLIFLFIGITLFAQTDTTADSVIVGEIKVFKDPRLNDLAKKEAEFNKQTASAGARSGKGFRLMLLSTNDRPMAMNIRTQLLQR